MEFSHISVLLNESIEALDIKNGIYVDGTMGGAGHSAEILKKLAAVCQNDNARLVAIDQDIEAIKNGQKIFKQILKDSDKVKVDIVHDNFSNIKSILNELGINEVDGILLDLGVSSYQLDNGLRGFSYNFDAPLDMRMNKDNDLTAYDVVNTYKKEQLEKIIYDYSDEKWARRIAEFIVLEREQKPIETTFELTEVIKKAVPKAVRREGGHPSKRTFQAIRIEVNGELKILEAALSDMIEVLKPGGRLAVITFHSLEDRIVKETFRKFYNPCTCPSTFPVCICGKKRQIEIINKKPILPSKNEIDNNLRARSAHLRVAKKVGGKF